MLTREQAIKYEEILELVKKELDLLDKELIAEIERSKEKIRELQEAKKAVKLIYDGACARLGVPSDLKLLEKLERQG